MDFKKRLTSAEALQHPWVVGKQADKELTGTRQNMESHLKKKFRAKVKSVIAANRMSILAGAVAAAAASTPATVPEGAEEGDGEDDEDEDKLLRKQVIVDAARNSQFVIPALLCSCPLTADHAILIVSAGDQGPEDGRHLKILRFVAFPAAVTSTHGP